MKNIKLHLRQLYQKIKNSKRDKLIDIAILIGNFYLDKPELETQKEVISALLDLGITDIDFKQNTIIITLQRPGFLIGKRGKNIDDLLQYVKKYSKYKKINVKENGILSWLIPYFSNDIINY